MHSEALTQSGAQALHLTVEVCGSGSCLCRFCALTLRVVVVAGQFRNGNPRSGKGVGDASRLFAAAPSPSSQTDAAVAASRRELSRTVGDERTVAVMDEDDDDNDDDDDDDDDEDDDDDNDDDDEDDDDDVADDDDNEEGTGDGAAAAAAAASSIDFKVSTSEKQRATAFASTSASFRFGVHWHHGHLTDHTTMERQR
jgi:hypothetical protein